MDKASHRLDIDGLRGIAVILVVLYHAKLALGGGFIGVDVFFVISGFLITRIIAGEHAAGSFSLPKFYLRRARRLLPAFFTVLVLLLVVGWAVLPPRAYLEHARLSFASVGFASNFEIFREQGYFDVAGEMKPLLHTWSLAVEEHFYLVWPFLLTWWLRRRFSLRLMLGLGLGASLLTHVLLMGTHESLAFYFLPTRAWELLAGAVLALISLPKPAAPRVANLFVALGLVLIGVAAAWPLADEAPVLVRFGLRHLAAVVGASLAIYAGEDSVVARRVLGSGVLVFFGKISYSLYLIHWPLLALARVVLEHSGGPTILETVTIVFAAVALSTVSWRYVETPFRRRVARARWRDLGPYAVGAGAVASVAMAINLGGGFPGRYGEAMRPVLNAMSDANPLTDPCLRAVGAGSGVDDRCDRVGEQAATLLIWGDSHADAVAPGFSSVARRLGWGTMQRTSPGCAAIDQEGECGAFNQSVLELARRTAAVKTVVLAARWPVRYCKTGGNGYAFDGSAITSDCDDQKAEAASYALERVAAELVTAGKSVVIVGPVPELNFRVPDCLVMLESARGLMKALGHEASCGMPSALVVPRVGPISATITKLARRGPRVCAVDVAAMLCRSGTCETSRNGVPLYRDYGHLTATAAVALIGKAALGACLDTGEQQSKLAP